MNQYVFLRRMRGPIFLLTFGVTAILDEYTGIHYTQSWPLYLIVWGVMRLAENALLAQNPPAPPPPYGGYAAGAGYPPGGYPSQPYPPGAYPGPSSGAWGAAGSSSGAPGTVSDSGTASPTTSTAIVRTSGEEDR